MGFEANTKDCSLLSDSEFEAMAQLSVAKSGMFDVGFLSKQRDEWILNTTVFEGKKLRAYSFFSLERIGGTPAIIMGLADADGTGKAIKATNVLLAEQFRKSVLAFPDEDVLMCAMLMNPSAYTLFNKLHDVVPRLQYKPTGEERAWVRRIAKRFNVDGCVDEHTFRLEASEDMMLSAANLTVATDDNVIKESAPLFDGIDPYKGDRIIVCGWAMAEDLASGKLTRTLTHNSSRTTKV